MVNKSSIFVAKQLPEFVQNEYPQFVAFLEAYYAFLEQDDNANVFLLNAHTWQDIDDTLSIFLPAFKKQYLTDFPKDVLVDERRLIKFIHQFFESKGTNKSIQFLFRVLFNVNIEVFNPSEFILRASDGLWIRNSAIKITTGELDTDPFELIGQKVYIQYYITTGIVTTPYTIECAVDSVKKIAYTRPDVYEIILLNIDKNAPIPVSGIGAEGEATLVDGAITGVTINYNGDGYESAPFVKITSNTGSGAEARALIENGEVVDVQIIDPGEGYLDARIEFVDHLENNDRRTTLFKTENDEKYGFLIRSLVSFELKESVAAEENQYAFQEGEIYNINETVTVGYYSTPFPPDPNTYFAEDYVSIGRNNLSLIRVVKVDPDTHQIQRVSIINFGLYFTKTTFDVTITSENNSTQLITFHTGALYTYPGQFKNLRGQLSTVNKLQDNYYYQTYSYVIKSPIPTNQWLPTIKNTVHPAGLSVFGELQDIQEINVRPYLGAVDGNILYRFMDQTFEEEINNSESITIDYEKSLTNTVSTTSAQTISFEKSLTDTSTISEVHVVSVAKALSDTITASESNVVAFGKVVSDTLSTAESHVVSIDKVSSDSVSLSDTIANINISKSLSDAVTASESLLIFSQDYASSSYFAEDYVGTVLYTS